MSICFIFSSFSTKGAEPESPGTRAAETIDFSIPLTAGWRFISIPVNLSVTHPVDVFNSIDGDWDIVQWYDPLDFGDHYKQYSPIVPPFLNDLNSINWTMGLWLHVTNNCTFTGSGTKPTEPLYLYNDDSPQNYIGFPDNSYPYLYTVGNFKASTNATNVWTGNGDGTPTFWELDNSTVMEVGTGYFINISANETWHGPWLWEAPPDSQHINPGIDFQYTQLDTRGDKVRVSFNYTGNLRAIREFRWNYGDSSGIKGPTETNPIHSYTTIKNYTVSLEVISQEGKVYNTTQIIVLESDFIEFDLDSGNIKLGSLTYWIPVLAISGLIGMGIALADPKWLRDRKYWNTEVQATLSTLAFLIGMFFLLIQLGIIKPL